MAEATLSNSQAAFEQRVRDQLVRQPNRSTVLLNLLGKNSSTGKNFAFDATFGTDTGQRFTDGEDVGTFHNDTEVMGKLDWCHIGDAFAITGTAEDAAAAEPTELANLWMKKLVDNMHRVAEKVNYDLWNGDGSSGVVHGLGATDGPLGDSGTYATLARGTYTQWEATRDDTIGPLSMKRLETWLENIYVASGSVPSFIVTTPALWRTYAELIFPEKRYMQSVNIRGQQISLDGGWNALDVNGIPMFKDRQAVAGSMVAINDRHMGVAFLPAAQRLVNQVYLGQVPIAGTPQEQAGAVPGSTGLMARLIKLAQLGDKSKYQVLTKVALWSDKCNAHGIMTNVG